jgi:hypothetical protein
MMSNMIEAQAMINQGGGEPRQRAKRAPRLSRIGRN